MSATEKGGNSEGETPLSGGFVTEAVKVGGTVRRAFGPWSPTVHSLLGHLESVGYDAAPRYSGMDERGREILSFIDGVVPDGARPEVVTDLALRDVGRLVRDLHRAVEGEHSEISWFAVEDACRLVLAHPAYRKILRTASSVATGTEGEKPA